MPSWNNNDNYGANVPLWITMTGALHMTPNVLNANLVFANTSANVFTQDMTAGVFGVNANEAMVARRVHTGWVYRTVGQGGRAGRVQEEVLVAMHSINGDYDVQGASVYPNTAIIVTTQPTNNVITSGADKKGSFLVAVDTIPGASVVGTSAFPITYTWQFNNGIQWINTSAYGNAFPFSSNNNPLLQYTANTTIANTWKVRCNVSSLDQYIYSSNALITVM